MKKEGFKTMYSGRIITLGDIAAKEKLSVRTVIRRYDLGDRGEQLGRERGSRKRPNMKASDVSSTAANRFIMGRL